MRSKNIWHHHTSPNSKISGGCLFVSFNSKDAAVYFKLLPQVANNPDKKNNFMEKILYMLNYQKMKRQILFGRKN